MTEKKITKWRRKRAALKRMMGSGAAVEKKRPPVEKSEKHDQESAGATT